MDTQPISGFPEILAFMVEDMANAVSERPGESKQQRSVRFESATRMINGLRPQDVAEAMLAGHCIMFHEVIMDSVHETLRGEMDSTRRGTRSTLAAMNKAFTVNFELLKRRPPREPGEKKAPKLSSAASLMEIAVAKPVAVPAGTPIPRAPRSPPPVPTGSNPTPENVSAPSAGMRAAFHDNPEAAAAMKAGDPLRFAHAMGIQPTKEFLAAAAEPGSPFNPRFSSPWAASQFTRPPPK